MSRQVVILVSIVLVAGAAGFAAYRLSSAERAGQVPVAQEPVAAPAADAGGAANAQPAPRSSSPIPDRLPEVTLPDREGRARSVSEWRGRPLVVNFWATWCAPCRKEIPLFKALRAERSADRLEILGIAVDHREDVLRFAEEIGIDYPVLIADENGFEVTQQFAIPMAFPVSLFADREARIVAVKVGELHRDEAELILDRVRDVDAGKLPLPAAQEQIEAGLKRLAMERAAVKQT